MSQARPPMGAASVESLMTEAAAAQGLTLAAAQLGQLRRYLETLLLWRQRTSLVSQHAPAEIVTKHFEDSFALADLVGDSTRLADLGTGAGFPGLVLAILRPTVQVFLVESKRRKASFLREAVRAAGVGNATVVEGRAEDLGATLAGLDLVVSRAVWPTAEFLAIARPLLRPDGVAVAMKTPQEHGPEAAPGYSKIAESEYELRGGEKRVLVVARAL